MSYISSVRFSITILVCASLLTTFPSCASKVNQQDTSSLPPTSSSVATSSISSSEVLTTQFITHLTQDGNGLVRNVPAISYNTVKPSSLSGDFDIRWLNCPKYLDDNQLKMLNKAIPNITFNSNTVWPSAMPLNYNYSAIFEAGKNPGFGISALHSNGITGKGVSIAIIDQTLFTGHDEYKDNLALYEEIHVTSNELASMHGSAVASIAVGKTCGVAPGSKLYYWAVNLEKEQNNQDGGDSNVAFADGLAIAVNRMLQVNTKLPENEKIRVLSISRGFSDSNDAGVRTFLEAIEKAKKAGIFVITTSTFQYYDFLNRNTDFAGLGKVDLTGNPDNLSTYTLGNFEQSDASEWLNNLLVPMDARTTADPSGARDYAFYAYGGFSWSAPYLAGLYALAVQAKPSITPKVFWETALKTSNKLTVTLKRQSYTCNHVINPINLLNALK